MSKWKEPADELMVKLLKLMNTEVSHYCIEDEKEFRLCIEGIKALTPLVTDGSQFNNLQKEILGAISEKD